MSEQYRVCPNCGALVADWAAHVRFHASLQAMEDQVRAAAG